jgi:hypothetical protein
MKQKRISNTMDRKLCKLWAVDTARKEMVALKAKYNNQIYTTNERIQMFDTIDWLLAKLNKMR